MKVIKLFCLVLFLGISSVAHAAIDVNFIKSKSKYETATENPWVPIVYMFDRYEADATLEFAAQGFVLPDTGKLVQMKKSAEILLIMPRIDELQKYLPQLAATTQHLYLFIMDDDKAPEPYGDRSWAKFKASGLENKLPKNVKVFRLKNESVTPQDGKNGFEYPTDILHSAVFKHQINPIFTSLTTVWNNYPPLAK
ncbi:hypothetical protein CEP48_07540 [Mergibacter septicus]|uniref:Uncharacterized protein n=1 Tax=Mergibacter septicus TaxID=221402 RepID=A0A8D4LJY9_9PAST|nr:hypothetical protein [Mergibacter septicus]AWX16030.1 hypothetical protein CEP47_07540 [Mergibacter septicus]QDJ15283.1 hypothetical protein CEP48_07540 [Mergibacter septicus]UTU47300.1 hypothetical protein HLL31_00040 [Mergibacter septicus]WMR95522.1 hypothetical protein RDJ12_06110 [Mergibacter septicus]